LAEFTYGKNTELRHRRYISYPLEALLLDAVKGVPTSRKLIFSYYSSLVERNENVPPQVQKFVANLLGRLADGRIDPSELIWRKGLRRRKEVPLSPAILDIFAMLEYGPSGKRALENWKGGDSISELAASRLSGLLGVSPPSELRDLVDFNLTLADRDKNALDPDYLMKLYRRQKAREERIRQVQNILDRWYIVPAPGPVDRWAAFSEKLEWRDEIDAMYSDLAKLD